MPLERRRRAQFFEDNFRPLRISKLGDSDGFLTGYYEPIVEGSRVSDRAISTCRSIAGRAISCAVGRGARPTSFPNTGRKVRPHRATAQDRAVLRRAARSRTARCDGQHLEICWLRRSDRSAVHPDPGLGARAARGRHDAADQLRFAQRPSLYAGRPHPDRARHHRRAKRCRWTASANGWRQHPDGGKELRRQNKSYVFFRITGLAGRRGADGRAGRSADAAAARSRSTRRCTSTARRSSSRRRSADRQRNAGRRNSAA